MIDGSGNENELAERLLECVRDLARELYPRREQSPPIGLHSRLEGDLGFDSLMRGELLLHLEDAFEVRLRPELVAKAKTPFDFLAAVSAARSGASTGVDRKERAGAEDAEPDDALICRQLPHEGHALGVAVRLLHTHKPFSNYGFGLFVMTLTAQIRRRHYLFTIKGKKVVGYVGWALCAEDVAEAWMARRFLPTDEESWDGPCWVGLAWCAENPDVVACQGNYLRKLYPGGKKIYATRDVEGEVRVIRLADSGQSSYGDEEGLS